MTEDELNTHVRSMIATRRLFGYRVHNSVGSSSGWPDWVIVGPGGILFRELKSETGQCFHEQSMVGRKLTEAGQDWAVWRPSDFMSGIISKEMEKLVVRGLNDHGGCVPGEPCKAGQPILR